MLKKGNKCIWTVNPKLAMDHWRFVRRAIFYNTGRFEQGRKKANRLMEGLTRQSWHFMSTGSPFVLFNVAYIPTKFLLFEKEFYDWLFARRVTNANSRCWPKEEKRLLAWVQLKETSFLLRDSATPLSIVIGTLDDPWWSCYDWGGPRLQLQQCKNLLMTSFLAVRFSQAHERREPRHSLLYEATKTKVSVSTVNPNMKTLTLLSSSCTTTTDDPLEQQQRKPPGFHFLCKFLFCLYSICCNCHFKWPDLLYNASHRLPISIF